MKVFSILILTATALLAKDGDEKSLKTNQAIYFPNSITTLISEFFGPVFGVEK